MKTQQNEMTRYLLLHSVTLSLLCVISYWLITHMLAQVFLGLPRRRSRRHVGRSRHYIRISLQLRGKCRSCLVADGGQLH